MRSMACISAASFVAFGLLAAGQCRGQDDPAKVDAGLKHWRDAASAYRIARDGSPPTPLALRDEPALKWTNPQRRADDGGVFLWLDRGRPEVAASFYRYPSGGKSAEDHEFVSLATAPLVADLDGAAFWSPGAGVRAPAPIPDAPEPAKTAAERLRQMPALAREFRASFNNPPDLSEIRLLTQPLYRFEVEGKRADILDGALFAYVHTTDPEVLLILEARPDPASGAMRWYFTAARMSLVNLRIHHKDREIWSAAWVEPTRNSSQPYFVRSVPAPAAGP